MNFNKIIITRKGGLKGLLLCTNKNPYNVELVTEDESYTAKYTNISLITGLENYVHQVAFKRNAIVMDIKAIDINYISVINNVINLH